MSSFDVAAEPVVAHGAADIRSSRAMFDTDAIENLSPDAIEISVDAPDIADGRLWFTLYARRPVPLRRILPLLESLDLEALDEHTTVLAEASTVYVYRLTLQAGELAAAAVHSGDVTGPVRLVFEAMWLGLAEADRLNALILAAGLSWRQVAVLRCLGRYLRQSRLPYGQARIRDVLLDNPEAAHRLVELLDARFADPGIDAADPARVERIVAARQRLDECVRQVINLDADRILRGYRSVIDAGVRTNAYREGVLSTQCPYLAFKIRGELVGELPHPRPAFETFVYSPATEGLHLRFGPVARGGIRWSDRVDDYRTEVLGLVKAQAVKNAVIVPAGAKGAFIAKSPGTAADRATRSPHTSLEHGLHSYREFIGGLLDLTDNRDGDTIVAPASVVCHDDPDPYLVVAADKGTARFSDTANEIATRRGFWLGDAFASGGSAGYDHKAMGITARGAWVSATHHLGELGIDVTTDDFTVVGIGDMSGDVFGNGMLLSTHIRLVAAFDHRHIFLDPDPDPDTSFQERLRLFQLPGSSWDDYDRTVISASGGVWAREAKAVPVTAQLRAALGIADGVTELTPDQVISAVLSAPVDLLWNGGVGTYIKGSAEPHSEVGDKVNDSVRVDAADVRAKVIVEGGNLGVSPRGRIEFARRGGRINSDAIDNAAGVDCSDHEVNIKILLDATASSGRIPGHRGDLLASMTDEVAALVLTNNRDHNNVLGESRDEAARMVEVHARMVEHLEARRGLRRKLENLPEPDEFAELAARGEGLTAPQLATLLAHVKLDLKADLAGSDLFDQPYFSTLLQEYFPHRLTELLGEDIHRHPLRREILVTVVVNRIVAIGGPTFTARLMDETAADTADAVRACTIAAEIFDIESRIRAIRDAGLPSPLTNSLIAETRRLLDRSARWFLGNRPQPLDIEAEIARFAEDVALLEGKVGAMLRGQEADTVAAARRCYRDAGVPDPIARALSEALYTYSLLDIIEAAHLDGTGRPEELAATYYALSDHLGIDVLLLAVSSLPRGDRWHALARLALREDLYRSLRTLTVDVARTVPDHRPGPAGNIGAWEQRNRPLLERSRRTLAELRATETHNLAALSVAATHIRRMSGIN
ncbi:NAD-glutamate dehydrogenase domain-containing protein [Nocardia sp. BMG51109]|uniref:NAD-glutamate dehydrogenase domain-containing protein n=1 Tax=Nocardia sp. BMG51109 TaxID=1056816 RepID=UPI000463EB75|nr:NAD-glutamate dehydrogenase domain-containing protein [Nocardia sp. BMG51109]